MTDPIFTKDGQPIAAWLLKANPDRYDIDGAFETFGVIPSWSVHGTYRLELLGAGQRVFLYVGGSESPGIWGVGEITGPVATEQGENDGFWAEDADAEDVRPYVPVEILRLSNPITRQQLLEVPALAECELFRSPQQGNPNVLRPEELQALEGFDLSTIEPTEEQLANLAEADEEPPILALLDNTTGYVVDDIGDEEAALYQVLKIEGEAETEIGTFADLVDAIGSLTEIANDIGERTPVFELHEDGPETQHAEPVAVLAAEDGGVISIIHTAVGAFTAFHLSDDELGHETIAVYSDLATALVDLFSDDPEEDDGDAS